MAHSGSALLALFLACLLVPSPETVGALTCGSVDSLLGPCISYVRGAGPLTSSCCSGVKQLAASARTTADRQTACNCLKSAMSSISGIKPNLISGVPGRCGVSVPYPISTSTDCSKVK